MSDVQATTHGGWFHLGAQLTLADTPKAPWRITAGKAFVLVLYSENARSLRTHDKAVFNDELVVQCPAGQVETGGAIDLAGCTARYQRGGQFLTFESITLAGAVHIEAYDQRTLAGRVELSAHTPRLDVTSSGTLQATARFRVKKKAV